MADKESSTKSKDPELDKASKETAASGKGSTESGGKSSSSKTTDSKDGPTPSKR